MDLQIDLFANSKELPAAVIRRGDVTISMSVDEVDRFLKDIEQLKQIIKDVDFTKYPRENGLAGIVIG